MSFQFQAGWAYDAERIEAAKERMTSQGCQIVFGDARPTYRGYWKHLNSRNVLGVFAQDDEEKLIGKWRDTSEQVRGTCVRQASERACEDVHNSRIADGLIVGDYTRLAGEPAYAYMRAKFWGKTHPWGCQCRNCPDGIMGADFAEYATMKGLIARGVYRDIDLSKSREDLEILWNNTGAVPDHLVEAGARHKFISHLSRDWNEYADATAAKNWGEICLPKLFKGSKVDKDGCCYPDDDGGHSTECCGVFLLPDGTTAFVIQQSWPLGATNYPTQVQTAFGPKRLRPNSYAIRQNVLEDISYRYSDRVERWSFDLPGANSFRKPNSIA